MSIRLRIIGAFISLILIIIGIELYDSQFAANISKHPTMINIAGSQRYRVLKLAYLAHRYEQKGNSHDLETIKEEIKAYENVFTRLKSGSKDSGLDGVSNSEVISILNEIESLWDDYRKQIEIITAVADMPAQERVKAAETIDIMVIPLLEKMDRVAGTLDMELTAAVEHFKRVKLYSILLFIFISIAMTVDIIIALVRPMNKLLKAIDRAADGDLESKFAVEGDNEFTKVAESFNHMTDNLRKSRKELEKVKSELEDFVYTVSHDLKEPLRSIASFSHFIAEDYHDKLDDEGRDFLSRIVKSSARMRELIDDLLTLSRVGRIQNPYQTVQSAEIIEEVLTSLHQAINEKKAEIKVQESLPVIYCDRTFMSEVFLNLLSNAIKFCDKDHPIVEIGCDELPKEYRFYVKDNGIGIEERYHEKVFEVFERLNRREEYEGTGAGLTIVKKVIEEHHGRVWLESRVGQGTTFYFTLPKEKEEESGFGRSSGGYGGIGGTKLRTGSRI